MSSHRLHPRVVATVLVALCLAVCAAPTAFASSAPPERLAHTPGGSVVGLGLVPDPHATVTRESPLAGANASRDTGENAAAALAAVALILVLVAPFVVVARTRGGTPTPAFAH
jgi:hypothetical protein